MLQLAGQGMASAMVALKVPTLQDFRVSRQAPLT